MRFTAFAACPNSDRRYYRLGTIADRQCSRQTRHANFAVCERTAVVRRTHSRAEPGRTVILELDDDDDTNDIHHEQRPGTSATYGLLIDGPHRQSARPMGVPCPGEGRAAGPVTAKRS